MIIQVRTNNIGFDVVPEHRSTTILNWIHYLENDEVWSDDKIGLHDHYMALDPPADWSGDVFYMTRDVADRFKDGYASFVSRHLTDNPNINTFIENLDYYEKNYPWEFNVYLDVLTLGSYTTTYNYDQVEDLRTMLETRYNKTIDSSIRDMHTQPHGDGDEFLTLRDQSISDANLTILLNKYS